MKSSGVRFTPRFVLKNIDPKEITKHYTEGKYATINLPESRIKISDVFHVTTTVYGSSPEAPRYQFKDKNNMSIVIVMSNAQTYDMYIRAVKVNARGGRCFWCLRDFETCPVEIPIRMETEKIKNKLYYLFWTEGIECCSYSCALSWVVRQSYVDPLYKCAEYYLRFLFRLQYPKVELIGAGDPVLLKLNKGSLTEEEYDKNNYTYRRTSNVIFFPAKVEYIQEQIS